MRNFQLVGVGDSKTYSINDLVMNDKVNLLIFYNTNCLGCTGRAIPYAYELTQIYDFINLVVIHVSLGVRKENKEEIQDVFTGGAAPFTIYKDLNNELYHSLKCEGTPHWIFMDGDNNILHSIFGSQEGSKLKIEFAIEEMRTKFS